MCLPLPPADSRARRASITERQAKQGCSCASPYRLLPLPSYFRCSFLSWAPCALSILAAGCPHRSLTCTHAALFVHSVRLLGMSRSHCCSCCMRDVVTWGACACRATTVRLSTRLGSGAALWGSGRGAGRAEVIDTCFRHDTELATLVQSPRLACRDPCGWSGCLEWPARPAGGGRCPEPTNPGWRRCAWARCWRRSKTSRQGSGTRSGCTGCVCNTASDSCGTRRWAWRRAAGGGDGRAAAGGGGSAGRVRGKVVAASLKAGRAGSQLF